MSLDKRDAAIEARSCFSDSSNCAESVLATLSRRGSVPALEDSLGSGFTSGIGHSGCLCGALAAAVMAAGAYADSLDVEPAARKVVAEKLAAEMGDRFKREFGATCCRVIKRGYVEGSSETMAHCAGITEFAAAMADDVIERHSRGPGAVRRFAFRDLLSAADTISSMVLMGVAVGAAIAAIVGLWAGTALWAPLAGAVYGLIVGAALVFGPRTWGVLGRAAAVDGVISAFALVVVALFADGGGPTAFLVRAVFEDVSSAATAAVVVLISLAVMSVVRVFRLFRYR